MSVRRFCLNALLIAAATALGRLVADWGVPPHLVWWLTPVVDATASLITSAWWVVRGELRIRRSRKAVSS